MWDCIRLKIFCTGKKNNQQTEKVTFKWKKTFANNISDKLLTFQTYVYIFV